MNNTIVSNFKKKAITVKNGLLIKTMRYVLTFLVVLSSFNESIAQSVVINKYQNGTTDAVELLVITDGTDLRGLIIKDFSNNNVDDNGGRYTFNNVSLWSSLRAGTLIVLRQNTSAADVSVSCSDFLLDVGLNNTTYFTSSGTFNIAGNDMVMIKSGTAAGTANNIHTLRAGAAAAQWTAISGGTRLGTTTNTSGTLNFAYVDNSNTLSSDFNLGTSGVTVAASATLGSGNNTTNTNFINFLRGPVSGAATSITSTGFTANWTALTGVTVTYKLDVATDTAFTSLVSGYNNLTVTGTSQAVTGLSSSTTYYYRLRAINGEPITSGNSCRQSATTLVGCITPTAYSVTGTGSYCSGGSGVAVGLANSESGVNYQLYNGAATVGSPVAGSGSAISFGSQTTAATYTVLATRVVGSCTNAMTGSAIVTINSLPTIVFSPTSPSYCSGGSGVAVTASGASTYVWSPATGLSATTGATVTAAPLSTTTYTVLGTDASSCVGSGTVTVTVNPLPSPTISGTTTISSGGSAVLTFTGVNGDIVFYWNGASTVSTTIGASGTSTVSVSPGATTTYSVTSATSALGCSQSITGQTATVTVSALPSATISGSASICSGASTNLVFSGTAAATVYYSTDGVTPLSVTLSGVSGIGTFTLSVTPSITTTYTLDSIVSGAYHGTISGSATITIYTLPTAFAVTGGGSYCAGGAGNSIGLSSSQIGVTYQLYNGAATAGSPVAGIGAAISFGTFTASGTYTVVATDNTTTCTRNMTGSASITINSLPSISATATNGPVCTGSNLVLSATISSTASPYIYSWSGPSAFSSSVSTSALTGTTTVTSIPASPSSPVYTVTVTDANGCLATGTNTVTTTVLPFTAGTITGTTSTFVGGTTTLSNAVSGGVWTSASTSVATVGASSGIVTGVGVGNAIISYSVTNSCGTVVATTNVTVTALTPTSISGNVWNGSGTSAVGVSTFTVVPAATTPGSSVINVSQWDRGSGLVSNAGGGTYNSNNFNQSSLANAISGNDFLTFSVTNSATTETRITQFFLSTQVSASGPTNIQLFYAIGAASEVSFAADQATARTGNPSTHTFNGVACIPPGQTATFKLYGWGGVAAGTFRVNNTTSITATYVTGVSSISATASNNSPVCSADLFTLSSAPVNGAPPYTYSWSGPSTFSSTVQNPSISAVTTSAAGTYTVTVSDQMGCTAVANTVATINPTPAAVTGASVVCIGTTSNYTNATGGGTWSSSTPSVASIGSTSGILNANLAGTTTITYTLGTGCYSILTITVVSTPGAITGTTSLCVGATSTLSNPLSGGTWSSVTTGVATIGSSSGLLTAIAAGTSDITYTLAPGCESSTVVTINPLPTVAAITGTSSVCVGSTTSLSSATSGGVWTSSAAGVASVGTSGIVTGVSAGNTTITYSVTNGFGCTTEVYSVVTVNANPVVGAITGTLSVCQSSTTALSSTTSGGVWTSGATGVATIGTSGIVTGVSAGNAPITYSVTNVSGCTTEVYATTTVNPTPTVAAITGTLSVCAGATTSLANATSGGVWSSSATSVATVGTSGIVSAVSAGTATITYFVTNGFGCTTTVSAVVTVNPLPTVAVISGASALCAGGSTSYTNATSGGVWVSSNTSVAAIGTAGDLSAISAGTTLVSYTVTNGFGCSTTVTTSVTVRSTPTAAPTNNGYICVGGTVTLTSNPANGANTYTWVGSSLSSSTVANPTATPTSTTVYSLTVSDGTSDAGCAPSTVYTTSVTVNATPTAAPTNSGPICNGGTVTLTANGAGGATTYNWSGSSLSSSAIANPTATPTVTSVYSLTVSDGSTQPGCTPATVYTTSVTVNTTPTAAPTNSGPICNGGTVTLTANPGGSTTTYAWSGPSLSSTTVANPTATPTVTSVYSLTVTNGTSDAGCTPTTVYTTSVTVRPTPTAAPTNNGYICVGGTVTLTSNPANGANTYTWVGSSLSSSTVANPTATPTSTTVYSLTVSDGTSDAGCAPSTVYTTSVTVNATPTAAPTNSGPICNGGTVTLTANGAGGATTYNWSGSSLSSSVVAAPTATPTVTSVYSLTVSDGSIQPGCAPATVYTTSVTVNATPTAAPTNSGPICNGGTVTLTANPGGSTTTYAWSGPSLSSTTVANPTATPTVTSVYSLTVTNGTSDAGCTPTTVYTTTVTVRPTPTAAPSNNGYICVGGTVTLTANPANGANTYTWVGSSLSSSTVANPTATPTSTTVYSLTVSDGTSDAGCAPATVYTTSVTVNATPTAAPTNSGPICNGGTVTLTANGAGGATTYNWSGSSLSSSAIANPTATPTVTSVYSLTVTDGSTQPGCTPATVYTTSVTVNTTPTAAPTNSGPICNGGTVTLTANPGGSTTTYSWSGPSLSSTTVANPTATPTVTSVYSLTVTNGTSDAGCTPTTVYTTSVTVRPTPTAAPTNNGYLCVGGTVTLTANPANGANTYTWVGSSLSSSTVANPTATPTSTTVYSLTVSDGTSDAGCAPSTVYTTSVTVNATPTAAPTNSGPICNGGTVNLTANGAGGATTYNWSGTSLSSSAIANPTATPTVTSVYSLTVSDGSIQPGCAPATVYTTSVTVNATPTAAPTNSGPICNGGTVTLTANPGGSTTTYAWSGPSLSSTTVANPTATPTVTSVYSLTVTNGTSDAGCTPTTVYTTSVTVRPTPTAAPTNNGYICVGGTVTLTANPANGANTYTWVGSSLSSSTVANPTATPTSTTVYSLTVSDGTSDAGCAPSTVYTTSVTVNATPTAAPTNSGPICNGGTVTLTANGAGGATTYNWSGSSLSSSVVAAPTATPTVTSVYSLTVSDGSIQPGCAPATVYTTSVTVNATPTAAPTNSGPICNGGTVTLTANPGGSTTTYAWSGPLLSSTTVANPTATPTVTSVYSLTITNGTAAAGCTPTTVYTTSVTVNPLPVVPSIAGTFTVCEGATTTLTNTTSGGVWSSSATSVATIGTAGIVTALSVGTTNISYSVTNGFGCNTTVSSTVTVNPVPVVSTITGTTTICETASTNLSNSTTGGAWSSANTSVATVGAFGLVTGISAGTATISYTVSNGFGCSTSVISIITVNPLPTVVAITGPTNVCVGNTITYSTVTTGGIWSSSNGAVATIGTGGIVSGISSGTANITYSVTNGFGCTTISVATITVNPLPVVGAITGTATLCEGGTTLLSSTTSSGVWSSGSTSVATIGTAGLVSGVSAGTANITYSVTSAFGCNTQVFTIVTINPLPSISAITGAASMCRFDSVTLSSATSGGVWSSLNSGVASVSATGVVTGVSAGSTVISYSVTNGFGCTSNVVRTVTVNALPTVAAITGTPTVCEGATLVLSSTTSGGTWTSSNATVATIGTSGIVSGLVAGTTTISYSVTNSFSCSTVVTTTVTVNPLPIVPSITGTLSLCTNTSTSLSNTTSGGVWTSSNPSIASINTSGTVTGSTTGTSTISYTVTNAFGCITRVTSVVTVNPIPVVFGITGATGVCANASVTLSSPTTGGVWSSSNTAVATAGTGGVVSGVSAGTTIITYTVTNSFGCSQQVTRMFTVNPIPVVNAISGTLSICQGTTTALSNTTASGIWSSGTTSVATVSSSGVVTALAAGTSTITYSVTNGFGCINTSTAVVTVNTLPVVNPITGTFAVCRFGNTTLSSSTSGGVWSSSNTAVGTISGSGVFSALTAGASTVSYTVTDGLGCVNRATVIVTVNATPTVSPISGATSICIGATGALSNSVSGGVWESSNTSVATIGTGGVIATVATGNTTISYTVTNGFGCSTTVTTNVTVNPLPTVAAISGTATLCAGTTSTLSNATPSGTWTSSTLAVATVNSSGVVTGLSAGTSSVSYTVTSGFGCVASVSNTVTVNPAPVVAAITGTLAICENVTTLLSNVTPSGTWSSSNTAVATVGSTGLVTGIIAGTSIISYHVTNVFGCNAASTTVVTVNPLPVVSPISGALQVCQSSTTALSNTTTGGIWSSSNASVATITAAGVVSGVSAGTALISYSVTSGLSCTTIVTASLTVNPLPTVAPITGPTSVCSNASVTFSDITTGGVWTSNNSSIATVSSTGLVTGVSTGNTTITYTVTNIFGCTSRAVKSINVFPLPVITSATGSFVVCEGSTRTLVGSLPGGVWSSATPVNASITASSGVVSALSAGTALISFQISATGCVDTAVVTINPTPVISGINFVCAGNVTQLTASVAGGTWSSSNITRATINATTGFVNGVSVGTANITYTIPTGCFSTVQVTVNTAVPNITGPSSVCLGETANLSHPVSGGTWVSSNVSTATISSTGVVSGLAVGTTSISYRLELGCYATRTTSVSALPNPIAGNTNVCISSGSLLTNTATGTWSSSNNAIATVDPTGFVSGISLGNAVITFRSNLTGCRITQPVTVNPLPAPIVGATAFCPTNTVSLSSATSGGVWSSFNPSVVSIDSTSGIATAMSPTFFGIAVTVIRYTLPTGCQRSAVVTVNPLPAPIYGSTGVVCVGSTTTFLSGTTGGTWSVSNPAVASLITGGSVSGVSAGTSIISYTNSFGCSTSDTVTVYPAPGANVGTTEICVGQTTILSNSAGIGTWSTTDYAKISVNATTGLITGINVGTAAVTYRITPTCASVSIITILPGVTAIGGPNSLCIGAVQPYTNTTTGGTWTSSNASVATIGTTGIVTAVGMGTTTLTYTTSSCSTTKVVTVNCTSRPIEEVNEVAVVSIYPNPISGNIFTVQTNISGTLTLIAVDGKVIKQYELSVGNTMLSIPDAASSGVYLARFVDEKGEVKSFRLVVNK